MYVLIMLIIFKLSADGTTEEISDVTGVSNVEFISGDDDLVAVKYDIGDPMAFPGDDTKSDVSRVNRISFKVSQ